MLAGSKKETGNEHCAANGHCGVVLPIGFSPGGVAANGGCRLQGGFHFVSMKRNWEIQFSTSFRTTLNFALRERGFSFISTPLGVTGLRVRTSTRFAAPQMHLGIRGGHWHLPE